MGDTAAQSRHGSGMRKQASLNSEGANRHSLDDGKAGGLTYSDGSDADVRE